MTNAKCAEYYKRGISETQICVDTTGGKSTCTVSKENYTYFSLK